ncbi:MAG: response regulator transcription factor [Capsulimonadaceae bacterium]
MTTVLIVEDERDLAALIARHVDAAGYTAVIAGDGNRALALAEERNPDLVVLDWMLPGLDGISVCRRLRKRSIVPIVMLTAKTDESDRVLGLEAGADDYVTKPFSIRELLARIHALLRRVELMRTVETGDDHRIVRGPLTIDTVARQVTLDNEPIDLTVKEYDLVTLLAEHPGRTFSRAYLLERIWGIDYEGTDRAVDTHFVRLRRKLGEFGARIVTVWGVGYRLEH